MILYLSMLLGILFVTLGKLNRVYGLPDFSWKIYVRMNIISVLMTLVAGIILVLNQEEVIAAMSVIFSKFPFVAGGLFSAICGAAGVSLFQYLAEFGNPRSRTFVGYNKKKTLVP